MEIVVRNETLLLDHRRALYWPARKALLVADTHFGKSALFRREGVALPEGSDEEDLAILTDLVRDHQADQLFILGDFVHGALPAGHRFYREFNAWLASQPALDVHVVLGNHDRYLDQHALPGITWHRRLDLEPFALIHDPEESDEGYFLAGHIHPVMTLSTRADSLRVQVFWERKDGLVLPSFGSLTGGFRISPGRGALSSGPPSVTVKTSQSSWAAMVVSHLEEEPSQQASNGGLTFRRRTQPTMVGLTSQGQASNVNDVSGGDTIHH